MIGALIRLQARTIGDAGISAKLEAMLERVDALATVHRRLYQSDDISQFDVGAFTENLVSDVVGASGRSEIDIVANIERVEIPSANASSLGLVLNEVLTNAIKHGFFDGRAGTLKVSVNRCGNDAHIIIEDDGPGLDGPEPAPGGLGVTLIKRLSRQARVDVVWEHAAPGTRVRLSFPLEPQ
jgi:two-component sensor histidine kinase